MRNLKVKISRSLLFACSLALLTRPALAMPLVVFAPEARAEASQGEFQELKQVESILQDMVQIRDLEVAKPVQVNTLDRTQLRQKLQDQLATEVPPEKIAAEEALYKHLGMLKPDFNYRNFMVELYTEQIGGFYDPKTQELRLIKGMSMTGLEQQMLIAHELTHALQDQHYHLQNYLKPGDDNDDRTLAQMALIEGDATLAASEYVQFKTSERPFMGIFEALGSVVSAAKMTLSFEKFRSAPKFIRDSLVFPYDQGLQFVSSFRQQGWSWKQMARLYHQPPLSTEQILHPQAYLEPDPPQAVKLSLQPYLKGAKLLSENVWGELSYRQYLQHYLPWKEARASATGWQGDRFQVFQGAKPGAAGQRFAFFSRWDSEVQAEQFLHAYRQSLNARYPEAQAESLLSGQERATAPGLQSWSGSVANGVLILEDLPPAQLKAALPALLRDWQHELKDTPAPAPQKTVDSEG